MNIIKKTDKIESVKVNLTLVRRTIRENRQRKTVAGKVFDANLVKIVKDIIVPQLEESNVLDLNDMIIAEKLNVTLRQAKRYKEKLSELNIVYVPEYGRQKKEGDYPIWLVNYDYVDVTYVAKTGRRKMSELYNTEFMDLYKASIDKVKKDLEDFEYWNQEIDETYVLDILDHEFYGMVQGNLNMVLANIGKTRKDYALV